MIQKQNLSVLTIACSLIGTVVGAGFATGQEILRFFTAFGKLSFVGIVISAILLSYFSWLIMHLSWQIKAKNHYDLLTYIAGQKTGRLLDGLLTISFIGVLIVMTAGAGAVFHDLFGFPSVIGSLILLSMTFCTVVSGQENVIKAISAVVPLMLITVLGVSIFTLLSTSTEISNLKLIPAYSLAATKSWVASAILYVSYNIILALAILSSLGNLSHNQRNTAFGSILGGLGLGTGIMAINMALICVSSQTANQQVPMLYLASRLHFLISWAYGIIIILEIYTTAVSILYGFTFRLSSNKKTRIVYAFIACSIALVLARYGFSESVIMYYPIIGWAGVLFLFLLVKSHLQIIFKKNHE